MLYLIFAFFCGATRCSDEFPAIIASLACESDIPIMLSITPMHDDARQREKICPYLEDGIKQSQFFVATDLKRNCYAYHHCFLIPWNGREAFCSNFIFSNNPSHRVDSVNVNLVKKENKSSEEIELKRRVKYKQEEDLPYTRETPIFFWSDPVIISDPFIKETLGKDYDPTILVTQFALSSVFSNFQKYFEQVNKIGFAYQLDSLRDYDQNGFGQSATPSILQLLMVILKSYFPIGKVMLYRFVHKDEYGQVFYRNLCIIKRKFEVMTKVSE